MKFFDEMISKMTDRYTKEPTSYIGKIIHILTDQMDFIKSTLERMESWTDPMNAKGKALDDIGADYNQPRGQATDEIYRILIKSKIARNLSDGTINTMIEYLSFLLQIDKTQVAIDELWQKGIPAQLKVDVPLSSVLSVGLTLRQFGQLVNIVAAAGVRANVFAKGTFRFSKVYNQSEYSQYGFSNLEGTSGGTLGYMYDPADDTELPI